MADARRPGDRVASAEIRAWARDNGWPGLGDRGRLPPEVHEAFEQAHGAPIDADEDLSAMDEDGLDDDVFDDDAATWTPPPADLEEARQRTGRDPEPAHLGRSRNRKPAKDRSDKQPVRVTRAIRADIEGKLAFWLAIPGEPWLRVDPYCGQAYAASVDQIASKLAPLVCQSPDLVRWFSKSSTFIMWTELGIACRPVAEAFIAHHVTRRVSVDEQGQAVESQGGVDFSAYSARQPNPAAA